MLFRWQMSVGLLSNAFEDDNCLDPVKALPAPGEKAWFHILSMLL